MTHSDDAKFGVFWNASAFRFEYDEGTFGPETERRSLDAIRASLLDPDCSGPEYVYGIAMDVGHHEDRQELIRRNLLFGAVAYAPGLLGREPVRSQGHVHSPAKHSGLSSPELFEVWQGRAMILMQEHSGDAPGRCFAIYAEPGDHVIVPPTWPHFVANADPTQPMVFVALCDRDYAFEYQEVRRHQGLAWFPVAKPLGFDWMPNPRYLPSELHVGRARSYPEFHVPTGQSLYRAYRRRPDSMQWVSEPTQMQQHWHDFCPIGECEEHYDSSRT